MSEIKMKFCKDCQHFDGRIRDGFITSPKCQRLGLKPADPVTGYEDKIALRASAQREPLSFRERLFGTSRCGPDAVFWGPK